MPILFKKISEYLPKQVKMYKQMDIKIFYKTNKWKLYCYSRQKKQSSNFVVKNLNETLGKTKIKINHNCLFIYIYSLLIKKDIVIVKIFQLILSDLNLFKEIKKRNLQT